MKNILWVLTFAVCSSVCAQAQTIADVARRERAAKQPDQSGLSVTNASLKKKAVITTEATGAPASTTTASPESPAPATLPPALLNAPATPLPVAPADTRDEKWWREKFEAARTDLRRAENQVALAQLELNSANRDYLTTSFDPGNRGLQAIGAAKQKLTDASSAVTTARTKLSQLDEDLRRAGAPAGWGR